jgi:hypothetical protein
VYVFTAARAGLALTVGSVGLSSDVHATIPNAMVADSNLISLTLPQFHLSDTVISSRGVIRWLPDANTLQLLHQAPFKRKALSTLHGQP